MNILESMQALIDAGLPPTRELPTVILMSHTQWEQFSAACTDAGITDPQAAHYWHWRMTGKVTADA